MGDFTEHFSHAEMDCKCGCGLHPSAEFMRHLEELRVQLARPMPMTSGYRCPAHDAQVHRERYPDFTDERRFGPHTMGAADANIYRWEMVKLLNLVFANPLWRGIGILQHGPDSGRLIHLDTRPDERVVWTYP